MIYTPFSDEIKKHLFEEVALNYVIPQWVNRVGGYDTEAVQLFNKNVGPVAGIQDQPRRHRVACRQLAFSGRHLYKRWARTQGPRK